MRQLRTIAMLITGLWLLLACGKTTAPSELSIGGGSPLLTNSQSLVRIAYKNKAICSGILIANDLVLTAGHCLKADDTANYQVIFPAAPDDRLRVITEFQRVRDDSLHYFPNFDIAWIKLVGNAPEGYTPASILGDTGKIKAGTGLTIVGTANDTPCNPSDSVCMLVNLGVQLKASWSSSHLINLAVVESLNANNNSGTCPGDSGGPVFVSFGGQNLLYGVVAGKDPIFTGGIVNTCGSPTSVLTRVGEYQEWIEATSGRTLKVVDPATKMLSIDYLSSSSSTDQFYTQWQDWFQKPLPNDASWTTVHKLLEQAVLEFKAELQPEEIPQLFTQGGEEWLKKITTLGTLTLGFPEQSVAVYDLRPLVVLQNLTNLTFLSRAYKGLEVLERLPKLQTLHIITPRGDQGQFAWNNLRSQTVENVRLSQIIPIQLQNVSWDKLPAVKSLVITAPMSKVSSSWLKIEPLQKLESLQLQELTCDQKEWPAASLASLKSLTLKTTVSLGQAEISCVRWDRLPNLSEISVQGYRIDVPTFTAGLPPELAAQIKAQHP